ncbi:Clp protease N-terminal domain-containing protein [Pseudonocardia sp. CA-107938]|uniref:Clp protease N-terminal domain-containing protein n=1 Tax=Pseudonocardia sp. CA-107938 TaxID=3240021 RepID=UPI003D9214D0
MFERFTAKARDVVIRAQAEDIARGADAIRSEHLLAALVQVPDTIALMVLTGFSVTPADVLADVDALGTTPSDSEALASIGIDLDEVRRQVEEAFGPGALDRTMAARGGRKNGRTPFDRTAKKVMELALREAIALKHNYIGTEHILLGMLHSETGAAQRILAARNVQQHVARVMVEELVRGKRAG